MASYGGGLYTARKKTGKNRGPRFALRRRTYNNTDKELMKDFNEKKKGKTTKHRVKSLLS